MRENPHQWLVRSQVYLAVEFWRSREKEYISFWWVILQSTDDLFISTNSVYLPEDKYLWHIFLTTYHHVSDITGQLLRSVDWDVENQLPLHLSTFFCHRKLGKIVFTKAGKFLATEKKFAMSTLLLNWHFHSFLNDINRIYFNLS